MVTPPDAEGKFLIAGQGVDRVVVFEISGPGIATFRGYLITRPGFDPKSYNEASQPQAPGVLHPEPGVIRPAIQSGRCSGQVDRGRRPRPRRQPGARHRAWTMANRGCHISAVADANGNFTLTGLPKHPQYYLSVSADRMNDKPVSAQLTLADTEGLTPVKAEAILPVNSAWHRMKESVQSGWNWFAKPFVPRQRP